MRTYDKKKTTHTIFRKLVFILSACVFDAHPTKRTQTINTHTHTCADTHTERQRPRHNNKPNHRHTTQIMHTHTHKSNHIRTEFGFHLHALEHKNKKHYRRIVCRCFVLLSRISNCWEGGHTHTHTRFYRDYLYWQRCVCVAHATSTVFAIEANYMSDTRVFACVCVRGGLRHDRTDRRLET